MLKHIIIYEIRKGFELVKWLTYSVSDREISDLERISEKNFTTQMCFSAF